MTGRIRVLLLVLVASILAFLGVQLASRRSEVGTSASGASAPTESTQVRLSTEPDRPRPDARIAGALRSIEVLSGHRDSLAIDWTFDSGAWHLQLRGRDSGTLPAYPSFADVHALLERASSGLLPDAPLAAAGAGTPASAATASAGAPPTGLAGAPALLDALRAFDALELADRAWAAGDRGDEVLCVAERALLELHLEANDQVGASDPLLARALAIDVLRTRRDSTAGASERCLLMSRLGYDVEACAEAGRLAPNDPIRAFVLRDDATLESLATRDTVPFVCYLRLSRFADLRDLPRWDAWRARYLARPGVPQAPILASELALGEFSDAAAAGARLSATIGEAVRLGHRPGRRALVERAHAPLGAVMDAFEDAIGGSPYARGHGLLDAGVVAAYGRSTFYSGLYGLGIFELDHLSSVNGAREFAAALGHPSAPWAAEFADWYAHLSAAKAGRPDTRALRGDLEATRGFGEPLLARTWQAVADDAAPLALQARVCAGVMDRRLDTRPDALWTLASVHGWPLFDLAYSEELMEAAMRGVHPADAGRRAPWAAYTGDRAALDAMRTDPRIGPAGHRAALVALAALEGHGTPAIESAYRAALAAEPGEYDVVRACAEHWFARGRPADARGALLAWLARPDASRGTFDRIDAQTQLARACQELHDLPAALIAANAAAASGKYSALARQVRVLEALGRFAAAESVALAACERYPDSSPAFVGVVRLLWRTGDPGTAAGILAHAPYPPTEDEWRWQLAPEFAHVFARRPDEALRAVDSMRAQGGDLAGRIENLAMAVRDSGNAALAFEIEDRAPANGVMGGLVRVRACELLRRARGDAAAREYLARFIDSTDTRRICIDALFAFGEECDEALWQLPAPRDSGEDGQSFWLVRAASVIARPGQPKARREAVERYLDTAGNGRYATLSRFLLGRVDRPVIVAQAHGDRQMGEVYYYSGLLAQTRGRYRDAARDYAHCIATGQRSNIEFGWALSQLMSWSGRRMSLDRICRADRAGIRETAPDEDD